MVLSRTEKEDIMKIKYSQELWPKDYHKELDHVNFTGFQKILWVEVEKLRAQLGLTTEVLQSQGKALFIHSTSVKYYGQLHSEDVIEVVLKLIKQTKIKLVFAGEIFKDGIATCSATFTLACADINTGKPTTLPE